MTDASTPRTPTLSAPLVDLSVAGALVTAAATTFTSAPVLPYDGSPTGLALGLLVAGLIVGRPAFKEASAYAGVGQQEWDKLQQTAVGGAIGAIQSRSLGLAAGVVLGVGTLPLVLAPTAGDIVSNLASMGLGALTVATMEGMNQLKLARRRARDIRPDELRPETSTPETAQRSPSGPKA